MSAKDLNVHFTSVADQVIQDDCSTSSDLRLLSDFCTSKGIMSELTFPPVTVVDVYHTLIHFKQTGTCDLEGIKSKTVNLLASTTVDTLTFIYNLTRAVFQKSSKSQKSSLYTSMLPKLTLLSREFPTRMVHLYYISCSRYTILVRNPRRPISVLSLLSKPLEKHTHRCMLKHLNDTKLLHPNQSGFGRTLSARLHLPISLITGFTTLTIINSMGSC